LLFFLFTALFARYCTQLFGYPAASVFNKLSHVYGVYGALVGCLKRGHHLPRFRFLGPFRQKNPGYARLRLTVTDLRCGEQRDQLG